MRSIFIYQRILSALPSVRCLSSNKDKSIPFKSLPMRDQVKKKLEEKGFPFREGHTNYILTCPFCTREKRSLYVDMDTGSYSCQPCYRKGTWEDLTSWPALVAAGSRETKPPKEMKHTKIAELETEEAHINLAEYVRDNTRSLTSEDKKLMDKWLGTSNLQLSTLLLFDLKILTTDKSEITLCWPWYNNHINKEIIGLKSEQLNKTTDSKPTTYFPKDGRVGMFGWNTIGANTKTVVITARELDAMALVQDCKAAVLTLPQGLTALPPELLPQLEMFDRIILWLGDDLRSRQAALQFAKKLNLKRCSIIRKSTSSDPNTPFTPLSLLDQGIELGEILESALKLRHDKIFTFGDIRSEVWYEMYHTNEIKGLSWLRYPDLNKILKGYRRGEMSIYTGQTGSGKTTLLSELSLDLCAQGVCTLWGSFEISTVRLAKTMLKQFSRVDLENGSKAFEEWADKYEALPMYFMNFHGATNIEQILETMRYAVYMYDVEHVIVDNLQFMVGLEFYNDKYHVQDKIVSALRRFATEKAVHVSLVVHPRKERDDVILEKSSIYGTAKAIQEADNIMILHSNPGQTKALEVCKNRFDGSLGYVRLQYNQSDCTFSNARSAKKHFSQLVESGIGRITSENYDTRY